MKWATIEHSARNPSDGAGAHLGSVVRHGQQDRDVGVVAIQRDAGLAGLDDRPQALVVERAGEQHLDLGGGLLHRDEGAQPAAGHDIHDRVGDTMASTDLDDRVVESITTAVTQTGAASRTAARPGRPPRLGSLRAVVRVTGKALWDRTPSDTPDRPDRAQPANDRLADCAVAVRSARRTRHGVAESAGSVARRCQHSGPGA
jgi:hypothetical protein